MKYVALEVACAVCHRQGVETVLGTWAVETRTPAFDPGGLHQRGDNTAVTVEELPDGPNRVRRRYKMRCPRCHATPVVREDKVDDALRRLYEPGAVARTHRIFM
ncbi:hypothetical protein [Intrasporangium flavum]|uniref:hypothetical protein n=1 Tax=Intrasporangium flavum TaxID=1428657 RepID=UPI00096C12B2|nr:hypothetical protein [Intrasporangium flavum]